MHGALIRLTDRQERTQRYRLLHTLTKQKGSFHLSAVCSPGMKKTQRGSTLSGRLLGSLPSHHRLEVNDVSKDRPRRDVLRTRTLAFASAELLQFADLRANPRKDGRVYAADVALDGRGLESPRRYHLVSPRRDIRNRTSGVTSGDGPNQRAIGRRS